MNKGIELGIRGFYRGFGAAVLTSAPASIVWYASYENIKPITVKAVGTFTDLSYDMSPPLLMICYFLNSRFTRTSGIHCWILRRVVVDGSFQPV